MRGTLGSTGAGDCACGERGDVRGSSLATPEGWPGGRPGRGADRARHERLCLLVARVAREHLGQLPNRLSAPIRLQQQLRQMHAQREIVRRRLDGSGQ